MNRNLSIITLLFISLLAISLSAGAEEKKPRIKKCQDSAGKWHYGDSADDECAHSKVIELDTRGIKRKEVAAPLTAQELKEREANREQTEKERKEAEDQQRRDQQLLATYAIEDDIISTRDRKISEVGVQIRTGEETLKSLRSSLTRLQAQAADEQRTGKTVTPQTAKTIANNESQIAKHEAHIQKLKGEQENMRTQYETELVRFRELKRKQVLSPSPAPSPTAAR